LITSVELAYISFIFIIGIIIYEFLTYSHRKYNNRKFNIHLKKYLIDTEYGDLMVVTFSPHTPFDNMHSVIQGFKELAEKKDFKKKVIFMRGDIEITVINDDT
jgi:hypothetical protein